MIQVVSMSDIAANVRARREALGMSKAGLARKAEIGRATVERVESGRAPSMETLAALATALGVKARDLMPGAKRAAGGR